MLERVTVILAAAWLLTLVLGRAPAAARHMVWTCAVAAALLTPVLSALPTRPVPLPAAFARWGPSAAVTISGAGLTANAPPSVPVPAPMASVTSQDAAATASRMTPVAWAVAVWAVGGVAILLHLVRGILAGSVKG